MAQVPSNLIPIRVSQLDTAPVASEDGLLLYVYQGESYKIRAGDLLQVAGVPISRQVIAGTGLQGGGQLSSNVTLSIAPGGVGFAQLANTGVTAGVYGDSTNVPVVTVDEKGRITAVSTVPVAVSGYVPTTRQVIAGTGLIGGGSLNVDVTVSANLSNNTPNSVETSGSAGVSTEISRSDHKHPAIDLSDDDQVDNILGLSNGGTARSLVMDPGAVIWSGADGLYVGAAGSVGQVLVSGGTNAPTWGSALVVSPQPANYFFVGPTTGVDADPTFRAMVNADLPDSGVVAGSYGSASAIPVVTVNGKGVITSVSTTSFSGGLNYKGAWNASTNTPTLASGVGVNGDYYVVSVAGNTNLDGITDWQIGDWALFNGTIWQKIDQTNLVSSVNGQTGAVSLNYADVGAPSITGVNATGTWNISISGNAGTVTNGLYSTGSYADPTWLTSLATSKLSGTVSNAQLANSSVTINGNTVSLGGSTTVTAVNPFALTIGSGLTGTSYNGSAAVTITNAAPDQIVSLTGGGTTTISGTYPNFTISSSDQYVGTVTSIGTGTGLTGGPITSTGTISFSVPAVGTWAATPSSANLAAAMTDETGTGSLVFGTNPTLANPNIDVIDFDTAYVTPLTAGQLGWDGNNTLGLGMAGGNVTQHIGEDQFFYCKATSTITKGQVIMFTGAVGASGVPTGAPATGITDGTYIMGIAAENIATNDFGLVQCFGTLRNVNTSGYVDGDILWYNPAVAGGLTKTKPSAPNVKVQMAAVINGGSSGGGTILIRISPGSTLGGTDSNAELTAPINGQLITFDGGNGYWKNTALVSGTAINVSSSANGVLTIANTGVTSLTGTASQITVSASTGSVTLSLPSTINVNTSGNAATATSLAGGAASQIPYQSATGTTSFISNGTAGQVLVSNGASAPTWSGVYGGSF